ncbi:probable cytokinin riboside 5'-monophosphate phosphoribohydrolase LOGL10 [Cornus florida]|uniref:probable cytokinin riboside 5'-monophosphate phosphoribohydrolase LOGL10 n=1 Tax=Cornus florida TaxID=4283 RepID=UPI0028A09A17|nr:probable cytokinin riboside 5'-monophosphate phosphoribohydrolase LOGL10 [Cornus florida]
MGFPVAGTLRSHVFLSSHHRSVKFLSFDARERRTIDFKFQKLNPHPRRISVCKQEMIDFEERTSPNEVKKEIERCYELIHRLGRGVVYLGSSRMGSNHPHYMQALELGREIANLLDCASWTGVGPGLMDAATKGALEAGKPVGGFKIGKEAGEWTATNFHPYLPSQTYLTCRFFSARKHGLVDAAVRSSISERTAVVALPGGIGTLDEIFEILALVQLERIGSELPVPFLLMNYDAFYSKLLDFLDDCEDWGTVSKGEVASLWKVCDNNSEALAYLTEFYNLPLSETVRTETGLRAQGTVS